MSPAKYGQHFLMEAAYIEEMTNAMALAPPDHVLEIGPGRGALTSQIILKVAHLTAVEIDPRMIDLLKKTTGSAANFHLVQGDILQFQFGSLPPEPFKVVGNLPYALTSPILEKISAWDRWTTAHLMVQKEVGKRLCAAVGTKDYSALTVGVNLVAEVESVFELPRTAFKPPPRVDSMVVRLTRRAVPLTSNIPAVRRVVQAAFQQRRKTIENSLSHGLKIDKEKTRKIIDSLGLSPTLRAQNLSPRQFIALATTLHN